MKGTINKALLKRILFIASIVIIVLILLFFTAYATGGAILQNDFSKDQETIFADLENANSSITKIDNIILLIGDGMGFNQIEAAKALSGHDSLFMESLPFQSQQLTRSLSNKTTDSAAAATALASGVKTINGQVGKVVFSNLKTSMDIAQENNMKTGIVTTDDIYGATPASFSGHALRRNLYNQIISSQLDSNIDYLIASVVSKDLTSAKSDKIAQKGYTYVDNYEDLSNIDKSNKYYGIIPTLHSNYETESYVELKDVAQNAIEYLDNENGFFLMIEGARIDKYNHKNNLDGMVSELIDFDETVEYCVSWAKQHKNTVVIVTADHESGGLEIQKNGFVYTTTGHSSVNVPLYVYGLNIEKLSYKNTDIFHMCNWAILK